MKVIVYYSTIFLFFVLTSCVSNKQFSQYKSEINGSFSTLQKTYHDEIKRLIQEQSSANIAAQQNLNDVNNTLLKFINEQDNAKKDVTHLSGELKDLSQQLKRLSIRMDSLNGKLIAVERNIGGEDVEIAQVIEVAGNSSTNFDDLSKEEKEVFHYLNFVRTQPQLFATTYVAGYEGEVGYLKGYAFDERKQSLIEELSKMKPINALAFDENLYNMAKCFAHESGQLGLVGHDRAQTSCQAEGYAAECCDYGSKSGLSIVLSLLIDAGENNAALGHRRICLSSVYQRLGVSIQPHTVYKTTAVLDFGW